MNNFGEELRKIRKEKKLSIRKLGELSGISHAYLSQIENGKRDSPKPELINKIAKALGEDHLDMMAKAGYISEEDVLRGKRIEKELDELVADLKFENDILNILKEEEIVYYNKYQLTNEERQKIIDVLKAIFPDYN